MKYEDFGHEIAILVDPDGSLSIEGCFNLAAFYINEGKKKNVKSDANETRDLGAAVEAVKTIQDILVNNAAYTDTAIVLAAIQVLSSFCLKMVEKLREDK